MKSFILNIICFLITIVISSRYANANHLTGGEIRYSYVHTLPNGNQIYDITIFIYRDALSGGAEFDNPLYLTVYDMDKVNIYGNRKLPFNRATSVENLPLNNLGPCAKKIPAIQIEKGTYTYRDTLPINKNGYLFVHQRCCRSDNISNLLVPGEQGSTYSVLLTKEAMLARNSNPSFNHDAPILICLNSNFEYQFSASDVDGNKLRYYLCAPQLGGDNLSNSGIRPITASMPPYPDVTYLSGYSSTQPFGKDVDVQLDSSTGIIRFSPNKLGKYTIAVCVDEYDKSNHIIGSIKRDLMFNVSDCIVATAKGYISGHEVSDGEYATCKGQTIQFENHSIDAQTSFWDFGVKGTDQDTSIQKNPVYTYPAPGIYPVTLIINKGKFCADTNRFNIRVFPTLTVDFDYQVQCEKKPVELTNQSVSTTDPMVSSIWKFNRDTISDKNQFNYLFDSTGPYNLTLLVETKNGCLDSIVKKIQLPPSPVADFQIEGESYQNIFLACNGKAVLHFKSTSNLATSYSWSINHNKVPFISSAWNYTFTDTGTYQIQLIINEGHACTDTITKIISIQNDITQVDFEIQNSCANAFQVFQDRSKTIKNDIVKYEWDFGDGTHSTGKNPSKSYANEGVYTVRVTITTATGCQASVSKKITVYPIPVVSFNNMDACPGMETILQNSSTISQGTLVSYSWNVNGIGTFNEVNPKVIFDKSGTVMISLNVVSDQGCGDTKRRGILVRERARPDFTFSNLCYKEKTLFKDSTQSDDKTVHWDWVFDSHIHASGNQVNLLLNQAGPHTVSLKVSSEYGCIDSMQKTIQLNSVPQADFILDGVDLGHDIFVKCEDSKVVGTINQSENNPTNLWNYGISGISHERSPQLAFSDTGYYLIRLTINPGTKCSSTKTAQVHLLPGLYPKLSVESNCEHSPTLLKDLSSTVLNDIIQRKWSLGDSTQASGQNIVHVYPKSGNYSVKLFIKTARGCIDSIEQVVPVYQRPQINFKDLDICPNQGTSLELQIDTVAQNPITQYLWDLGNGIKSSDKNPKVTYPVPGAYPIHLQTTTANNCIDSLTDTIRVRAFITPIISINQSIICEDEPIVFTASASEGIFQTYSWNFDNGTTSTQSEDSTFFSDTGKYVIHLKLSDSKCGQVESTQEISVKEKPDITLGDNFAWCPNLPVQLQIESSSILDSIFWSNGKQNKTKIEVLGNVGTVSVKAYKQGCANQVEVSIIPSCEILAPQVFSPNNDGVNDFFNLLPQNVQTFQLHVFNRWGKEVFSTQSFQTSWDGTYRGVLQPTDSYSFYASGTKVDGSPFKLKGTVLLIR